MCSRMAMVIVTIGKSGLYFMGNSLLCPLLDGKWKSC
jgi:hypothetical protein